MNVGNCPRCGKLYALNFKNMCPDCIKGVEKEYERCVEYLREKRGADIQELSDAVEVSIKQITIFIREGRISMKDAPNLMYPCEVCGTLIREGNMCQSCRARLTKDLAQAAADQGPSAKDHMGTGAYKAVDKLR
ncbi:flagellar protein [Paenibacillus sp. JX-17]|uniref:Flagellar protein n=1 Tax=Paenibacillus lacisoli TaxID=3064525 RepID=A0ABT9CBB6_9BACL|nr:flagellar protein [Paenibacillus sp. JX-17]MDO7906559.1 flagellar protein [Paenibacillus sp. JX-17]